jgi:hypothetical protein
MTEKPLSALEFEKALLAQSCLEGEGIPFAFPIPAVTEPVQAAATPEEIVTAEEIVTPEPLPENPQSGEEAKISVVQERTSVATARQIPDKRLRVSKKDRSRKRIPEPVKATPQPMIKFYPPRPDIDPNTPEAEIRRFYDDAMDRLCREQFDEPRSLIERLRAALTSKKVMDYAGIENPMSSLKILMEAIRQKMIWLELHDGNYHKLEQKSGAAYPAIVMTGDDPALQPERKKLFRIRRLPGEIMCVLEIMPDAVTKEWAAIHMALGNMLIKYIYGNDQTFDLEQKMIDAVAYIIPQLVYVVGHVSRNTYMQKWDSLRKKYGIYEFPELVDLLRDEGKKAKVLKQLDTCMNEEPPKSPAEQNLRWKIHVLVMTVSVGLRMSLLSDEPKDQIIRRGLEIIRESFPETFEL